jgi:hypothetical protein
MPVTQQESGLVATDTFLHAVLKRINANTALCGAGRISQFVAGRFDTDDPRACAECVARLA